MASSSCRYYYASPLLCRSLWFSHDTYGKWGIYELYPVHGEYRRIFLRLSDPSLDYLGCKCIRGFLSGASSPPSIAFYGLIRSRFPCRYGDSRLCYVRIPRSMECIRTFDFSLRSIDPAHYSGILFLYSFSISEVSICVDRALKTCKESTIVYIHSQ